MSKPLVKKSIDGWRVYQQVTNAPPLSLLARFTLISYSFTAFNTPKEAWENYVKDKQDS